MIASQFYYVPLNKKISYFPPQRNNMYTLSVKE